MRWSVSGLNAQVDVAAPGLCTLRSDTQLLGNINEEGNHFKEHPPHARHCGCRDNVEPLLAPVTTQSKPTCRLEHSRDKLNDARCFHAALLSVSGVATSVRGAELLVKVEPCTNYRQPYRIENSSRLS